MFDATLGEKFPLILVLHNSFYLLCVIIPLIWWIKLWTPRKIHRKIVFPRNHDDIEYDIKVQSLHHPFNEIRSVFVLIKFIVLILNLFSTSKKILFMRFNFQK